jgi:hypothetical protein
LDPGVPTKRRGIAKTVPIATMQHDTGLPFDEIESNAEAMYENIEKIIDLALVKMENDEQLRLRFITLLDLESWIANANYANSRLTLPEEHVSDMDYISVSYCWAQEQSADGQTPTPDYFLMSPWKLSISCPPLVFYRSMQFVRRRRCPYLWINQDCINQNDVGDIEKHLQIMQRVYSESR